MEMALSLKQRESNLTSTLFQKPSLLAVIDLKYHTQSLKNQSHSLKNHTLNLGMRVIVLLYM